MNTHINHAVIKTAAYPAKTADIEDFFYFDPALESMRKNPEGVTEEAYADATRQAIQRKLRQDDMRAKMPVESKKDWLKDTAAMTGISALVAPLIGGLPAGVMGSALGKLLKKRNLGRKAFAAGTLAVPLAIGGTRLIRGPQPPPTIHPETRKELESIQRNLDNPRSQDYKFWVKDFHKHEDDIL